MTNPFQYTAREFDTESNLYYYRARYYDSTNGRFLTEDPIGLGSDLDFYRYVRGNPVLFVDPLGLWRNTHKPADPKLNTIVCDGKGGIRPQIGSPGTPEQQTCYGDCMLQHENSHKSDALASKPLICKGAANGIQIGFSNQQEQSASEIAASTAEINCLNSKKQQNNTCGNCKPLIDQRINQMEGYRNGFQTQ